MTDATFNDPRDFIDKLTRPDLYEMADAMRSNRPLEGEKKLLAAVLQEAVDKLDMLKRDKFDWLEAQWWVMSKATDWIFTFENVCAGLGIDADYVRTELKKKYGLVPMDGRPDLMKRGIGQHGCYKENRDQKHDQAKSCRKANGQPNGYAPRANKRCHHYTKEIRRHKCRRNPHWCYCCSRCAVRCPRLMGEQED